MYIKRDCNNMKWLAKKKITIPYLNFSIKQQTNKLSISKHVEYQIQRKFTPQKHRFIEQLLKSPGIQELIKDSVKSVLNNPNHITLYRYENLERSESLKPSSQSQKLERNNNTNVLKHIYHLKKKKKANSPKYYKKSFNLHEKFKQGRFLQMFPQFDGQNTLNIQSKPIHVISLKMIKLERSKLQESFLNNSMDAKQKGILQKK